MPSPSVSAFGPANSAAVRDLGPAPVAVRPAVLHLEAGVLRARLLIVTEFRRGLGELDAQLVGAGFERQRRGRVLFFAGPVVAEDHPGALAAAQHHAPLAVPGGGRVGPFVAGRRRARPELIGALMVDQQGARPGDGESLRAAEPRAGRVVHQQAVVHAGELQVCCGDSVAARLGSTVGTGQFSRSRSCPEAGQSGRWCRARQRSRRPGV